MVEPQAESKASTSQDAESSKAEYEARNILLRNAWLSIAPKRFRKVRTAEIGKRGGLSDGDVKKFHTVITDTIDGFSDEEPRGLLLSGSVGCGKTAAMYLVLVGYLQWFIHQNLDQFIQSAEVLKAQVSAVTHYELVRDLREYFLDREDEGERPSMPYSHVPLLCVDDLGRGYDDKHGMNLTQLDELFDLRWREERLTVVTTNKTPEELKAWSGWERIIDRLLDPSWNRTFNVGGESGRRKVTA
jgi:DNA replication protein DnaC